MRAKTILVILAIVVFLLVCAVARAENNKEFSALGGMIGKGNESSYTWELELAQNLKAFRFSVAYLNEGHFNGVHNNNKHYRDGFTTQIWAKKTAWDQRFTLGVGVGPYLYFDTVTANKTLNANVHGFGGIVSASATYIIAHPWNIHFRINYVEVPGSNDTFAILGGFGYQLDSPSKTPVLSEARSGKNEVAILLGKTTVNNVGAEYPLATNIEYRRQLPWKNIDWTVSYLDEGESGLINRRGAATELWVMQRFFKERVDLGIGAGAYAAFDAMHNHTFGLNGIITMTAGYLVYEHWGLRAEAHRIVTDYDRDSDVFLVGIRYIL